jgi:hypothetical protein
MLGTVLRNFLATRRNPAPARNDPELARTAFLAGESAAQSGDFVAARESYERALALDPSLPHVHVRLSQLRMPGPSYVDVLRAIHGHLRPRTYLEVGVETGMTLRLASPETRSIGVDPEPILNAPLNASTTLHTMTSDAYFAGHDVRAELGGLPIDLAFIDGMHHFEFALRDFINIERNASPQSTVLIHDCYPFDRATAERERKHLFWSGDIWRLVLILKKYRPDLRVNVIATAPTGLGVVRGLAPASRVLAERVEEIVAEFAALDYSALEADKPGMLALFPNDWDRIKAILQ